MGDTFYFFPIPPLPPRITLLLFLYHLFFANYPYQSFFAASSDSSADYSAELSFEQLYQFAFSYLKNHFYLLLTRRLTLLSSFKGGPKMSTLPRIGLIVSLLCYVP